ncbi:MAG: L-2-hydroxyglutarate oxidase [Anaerolineae bacterium]
MPDFRVDLIVIGAGIVGLATAMELVRRRPDLRTVVLDKENRIAAHQSGNNSGVIHVGLYYRPGSLKARLAVEGARRMVQFCQEYAMPYQQCGKVVVATREDELPRLKELYHRGVANGVSGLRLIDAKEIQEYEPHVVGVAGLWSPHTAIVDYRAVCDKYAEIIEHNGGEVRLNTKVNAIEQRPNELVVHTTQGPIHARAVINCGGLQSDLIARMMDDTRGLHIVPFRGEYYELKPQRQALVHGLIYPVPDPRFPFLGVHFTKRINGAVEAGPNAVLAFAREAYRKTDFSIRYVLDLAAFPGFWAMAARYWKMGLGEMYRSLSKRAFVKALQRLLPELSIDDLEPGGAGVRAQAVDRKGNLLDDFYFVEGPRAIHVLNAPSPAATASLSIGQTIADKALGTFGFDV